MTLVCELPDAGPWSLCAWEGRVFSVSRESGLYEVVGGKLVKVELRECEPVMVEFPTGRP